MNSYNINEELYLNYKNIVTKEYQFIKKNQDLIKKNARIIYNQKTKKDIYFKNKKEPQYLKSTVDFLYAEKCCNEFKVNS